MPRAFRLNSSRITGIVLVVIGLLVFFVLIPVGIVSPSNLDNLAIAPDFWPRIVAGVFTLMGIVIAVKSGGEAADGEQSIPWSGRLPRLAVVLAALFGFYFAISSFGMVAPAMALIFGLMLFAGERRWWLMILVSTLVPILLYIFFVFVANIPIPLGLFETLRG